MASLPQATAQWVADRLREIERDVEARRVEISQNNGRIIALDQRVNQVTDTARRQVLKRAISELVKRQAKLAGVWRGVLAKAQSIAGSARRWLSSTAGLSALPVVPVAIVAGLALSGGVALTLAWLKSTSRSQAGAIDYHAQLVAGVIDGRVSAQDANQLATSFNQSLAESIPPPPDPTGLTGLAKALLPLALIAFAAYVGPSIIAAISTRRRRAVA